MTVKCDPIFKLLKKHDSGEWTGECQIAFDKVKDYLSTPPILVPPIPKKPLILYLTIYEKSMGCVLGQHDETGKKEHAIYYLSKKFTDYESKYPLVEKMCCAQTMNPSTVLTLNEHVLTRDNRLCSTTRFEAI